MNVRGRGNSGNNGNLPRPRQGGNRGATVPANRARAALSALRQAHQGQPAGGAQAGAPAALPAPRQVPALLNPPAATAGQPAAGLAGAAPGLLPTPPGYGAPAPARAFTPAVVIGLQPPPGFAAVAPQPVAPRQPISREQWIQQALSVLRADQDLRSAGASTP